MIIVRIENGLGNQLFEYAFARAWKEEGYDVRLDMDKTYEDSFIQYRNNDVRQNSIQNFNITLPTINVKNYGKYQYIERNNLRSRIIFSLAEHDLWKYRFYEETIGSHGRKPISLKGNCYVRAWFQEESYFKHIRKILLKELTLKKKIKISKELRQALDSNECVSVHIRRGDYVKIHYTLKASYYEQAMAVIRKRYQNPVFLIFSDDLEWARKNLAEADNCIYVNADRKLHDYEELMIMSRCRSNIISNSTFSWWGAWLNQYPDKIVIAPKGPWVSLKQRNIIPKEWMTL